MTIAGLVDVALGSLGLAAGLAAFVYLVASFAGTMQKASRMPTEGHLGRGAGFVASGAVLVGVPVTLLLLAASAYLLRAGTALLRDSAHARRAAWIHAGLTLPFGALGLALLVSAPGVAEWLPVVLLGMPAYAIAQVAAFKLLPSWKTTRG